MATKAELTAKFADKRKAFAERLAMLDTKSKRIVAKTEATKKALAEIEATIAAAKE